jgi:hypothetical protein
VANPCCDFFIRNTLRRVAVLLKSPLEVYSPRNRRSRGPLPDAAMFLASPLREVGDARRVDGDPGKRPAAGVIDDVIDPAVHGQVDGHQVM